MKNPKFKKGEWCFCNFKLQQVTETNENRIESVSDGIGTTTGDLTTRCFSINMHVKKTSDDVAYWSREFNNLKINGLNHPDLNSKLIDMWIEMCQSENDEKKYQTLSKNLIIFGCRVRERVNEIQNENIDGVYLFRR